MSFGAILLLALGLSMDATAVSAARGLAAPALRLKHVALVAGLFGAFQALMPLLGWLIGASVGGAVQAWDHWIAFGLLSAIGGKMLWEARGEAGPAEEQGQEPFELKLLLLLALATSVDALAAGFTLPLLDAPLLLSLTTIGVTTCMLSAAGLWAGRRFGAALGKRLDAAGGLILIALGSKILIEHLAAT